MGQLTFQATLGGSVNLVGPNTASTTNFTLPSADGTSGQPLQTNGSGTLSFATLPVLGGGTGVTTSTGSGSNVLSTSPTLVTPILGTPTSGNLANCTFPTLNQNTSGTAAGLSATLAVSSGGTGLTSTPANGALDIGNGTGFTRTTLTQGTGITITNASGSITIAASGAGTVTSVATSGGLTGGTITTSGTLSINTNNTAGVGSYCIGSPRTASAPVTSGSTVAGSDLYIPLGNQSNGIWQQVGSLTHSGTWRNISIADVNNLATDSSRNYGLFIRTA